ncbi:MAG: hypothetical protein HC859_12290 [Bacteroidia bacterium]|nr:hypothetical protein [Bacteroidia bacterium]
MPESATEPNKISIGGMGYAIACTMLAGDKSLISEADARQKVLKLIRWLYNLSPTDGLDGWYGVPWHYINRDYSSKAAYGIDLGIFEEVSTIDWAMCMAALRVARVRYQGSDSDSHEIRTMIDELINKTHWGRFRAKYKTRKLDDAGKPIMDEKNKPVMNEEDFKISMDVWIGGEPNKGRGMWGVAFSEETDLVYAEAYATALEKQAKQNYKKQLQQRILRRYYD